MWPKIGAYRQKYIAKNYTNATLLFCSSEQCLTLWRRWRLCFSHLGDVGVWLEFSGRTYFQRFRSDMAQRVDKPFAHDFIGVKRDSAPDALESGQGGWKSRSWSG
jgi:hypothetical protein